MKTKEKAIYKTIHNIQLYTQDTKLIGLGQCQ